MFNIEFSIEFLFFLERQSPYCHGVHRYTSKCWLVLLAGPLSGIISRTIFIKEWKYLGLNTRRENYRPRKMISDVGNFQTQELHLSTRLFQVTFYQKIFTIEFIRTLVLLYYFNKYRFILGFEFI